MARVGKDSSKENRKSARYEETQLNNENFTKYYKSLGTVLENEWDLFIKSLQTPLPVNYRFTAFELKELMIKEYFPDLKKVTIDGISVPIPAPIPCVSMIPPLLLDVKPYHFVMDMCAAPGSKTAQLIEAMHSEKGDDIPDGLLIANDADYDRSYMLVRQTRRLQSPCLMVTNHEAQHFPHILYSGTDPGEKKKGLIFDRILCDAPCSGDGTLRKNKGIWKSWSGNNGNSLHKVQLQILEKGIELLKIGGRIVYSTCSFNPVENEAVVAEILKICGKSVELLDVSKELPELRRTEGLSHWTVMSKDGTIYKNYEDVPKEFRNIILPSAFPPPNSTALGLNKCLRILPHYHDTGGFFVAVFKKVGSFGFLDRFDITDDVSVLNTNVKELPHSEKHHLSDEESRDLKRPKIAGGTADESNLDVVSNDDGNAVREKKGGKRKWRGKESPFIFLAPQSDEVQSVVKFYGIIPNALPIDQFLVRSDSEKKKTIYFCSKSVKNTLQAKNVAKLNIVNSGIKMFTRNEGDGTIGCDFRLCNDGVSIIANVTTKRRIVAKLSDVLILLREPYPKVDKFSSLIIDGLKELGPGSCLFSFNPSTEKSISIKLPMLLPIWRAKASCSLLLDKAECRSLLLRLTGEEYLPKKLEIDKNDNQEVLENSAQQEVA
ncbi:tRNA (cytosine(34)-C(5))-methyltransferase [Clydaea vesicula]|uniref:tRNA (Cytosine(34)-C(5))-methyltransferase n=1 Tax=Clydaea vesicula TaxID=447962 RepID=A0AAD5U106_9FUNG|nr:tRNA (cytosine(34)-C(5))-methyltransferase [Clydaea vesicula]